MNFLFENIGTIALVLGAVYPPLLFVLPAATASKIGLGVKLVKTIADTLEKAQNTKGGLTTVQDEKTPVYMQKSKGS